MFIHLADQAGVAHKYYVDSAGTSAWHVGERPDSRMRRVAARHGLKYDGRSRQFRSHEFRNFDLIMVMDNENLEDLFSMTASEVDRAKIHIIREYDPLGGQNAAVPDPYYGNILGFEETYQVIERSCKGLLESLEGE
jgi:protein-tyrosine phosphatase